MPEHDTAVEVVARGREVVIEAATYKTEFATLAIPPSKATELSDILDQIEATEAAKASGNAATVGATAGVDQQVEIIDQAVSIVGVIMENVFEDDPVILAEWLSASHVKRAPKKAKTQTPPSP